LHHWKVAGWKTIGGAPYLVCKMWAGPSCGDKGFVYMSRELANAVLNISGAAAYTVTKVKPSDIRTIDFDFVKWAVAFIRGLFKLDAPISAAPSAPASPAGPTIPDTALQAPESRLKTFCESIKAHEGWYPGSRSQRNNNPGNCRYSKVGYAAVYGKVGRDAQGFAIFRDYTTGWLYLNNLVKEKIRNSPLQDFYAFFEVYAPSFENDSRHYAEVVAKGCGLKATDPVSRVLQ
jgi:hypothetical protein